MRLAEKFGLEADQAKQLIDAGIVNCSYSTGGTYDMIYYYYKSEIAKGVGSKQAVHNTSEKVKLCEKQVYNILKILK